MNVSRGTLASLDYLAGILGTSGSMMLRTSKGYTWPVLRIDGPPELLDLFIQHFGGTIGKVPSRPKPYWLKQGQEAQKVLRTLRPYMLLRGDKADALLAWVSIHPGKALGPMNRTAAKRAASPSNPWAGLARG